MAGFVAIIAAIFVVGGVIYQGDRKGEREAVAHIASLQTEIGNRIDSLEDRVINLEGDMGLLLRSVGRVEGKLDVALGIRDKILPGKGSDSETALEH